MNFIDKLKHKFAKWIWRKNQWTQAVDDVENAIKELRGGKVKEIKIKWHFAFMKTPPSNKFTVRVCLDE